MRDIKSLPPSLPHKNFFHNIINFTRSSQQLLPCTSLLFFYASRYAIIYSV